MNVQTNNAEKCDQALQVLHEVYDPEIGLNIVDLGLVYELNFDEADRNLFCRMTLTTQFCPMGASITGNVQQMLRASFPAWDVRVDLTFEPAWDLSKLSQEGREFLGQ